MLVNDYFRMFALNDTSCNWFQMKITFLMLNCVDLQHMALQVNEGEVKSVVFAMNPWKDPRTDGFAAGFYQKSWDVVGSKVSDFVREKN